MFRKFLEEQYENAPKTISQFASSTYRLVRISRRYWRGLKRVKQAELHVDHRKVTEGVTTTPSWRLLPDDVAKEFKILTTSVEHVIADYCLFHQRSSDDDTPSREAEDEGRLFGKGTYMIDVASWPKVQHLLKAFQTKWAETADEWSTEDGYQKFKHLLKEQIPDDYPHVEDLLPDRHVFRTKFSLEVKTLPFRLAEDIPAGDQDAEAGRQAIAVEMLETAVRQPREEAATAWRRLAAQLAVPDGASRLVAATRSRTDKKTQEVKAISRGIRAQSLALSHKMAQNLARTARTIDPDLAKSVKAILHEIPATADAQKALAETWNQDDTAAVAAARMLLAAADAAADETGMCAGLGRALRGEPALI